MGFETTVLLLTWVAILLLAFVVAGMVRRVHFLSSGVRAAELGPVPGSVAPEFTRLAPGAEATTLLLFLDAECGACPEVLAEVRTLTAEPGRALPVVALFAAETPDGTHDGVRVFADEAETFEEYQIPVVPFAVLVDPAGRVRAARPVGSPGALRD
ncbi:MAG TPA: hypothetical protein VHJ17_15145, partial [Thermomonospora sp.]|nr:hypothetical protein [Thermomonospora sp.]